jgi:hypothetical protein
MKRARRHTKVTSVSPPGHPPPTLRPPFSLLSLGLMPTNTRVSGFNICAITNRTQVSPGTDGLVAVKLNPGQAVRMEFTSLPTESQVSNGDSFGFCQDQPILLQQDWFHIRKRSALHLSPGFSCAGFAYPYWFPPEGLGMQLVELGVSRRGQRVACKGTGHGLRFHQP